MIFNNNNNSDVILNLNVMKMLSKYLITFILVGSTQSIFHIFSNLLSFFVVVVPSHTQHSSPHFPRTEFSGIERAHVHNLYFVENDIFHGYSVNVFFFSSSFSIPEISRPLWCCCCRCCYCRCFHFMYYYLYAFWLDSSWLFNCSNVTLPIFGYIYMDNIHIFTIFPNIIADRVYRYHINIFLFRVASSID